MLEMERYEKISAILNQQPHTLSFNHYLSLFSTFCWEKIPFFRPNDHESAAIELLPKSWL